MVDLAVAGRQLQGTGSAWAVEDSEGGEPAVAREPSSLDLVRPLMQGRFTPGV